MTYGPWRWWVWALDALLFAGGAYAVARQRQDGYEAGVFLFGVAAGMSALSALLSWMRDRGEGPS